MANNRYDNLSQVDYCMRQYFSKYMAPTIAKASDSLRKQQEKEYSNTVGNFNMPTLTVPTQMIAAGANTRLSGKWNSKTTDDLINYCKAQWNKDGRMAKDYQTFLNAFYRELVKLNGGKETPQLQTYAENYVANRFQNLIIEQLAREKVPRNSAEYIARKAFGDSLAGMVVQTGPRKGAADNTVSKKAEEMYRPNILERGTAVAGAMAIDAAVTGGYGAGKKAAIGVAADGAMRSGFEIHSTRRWNSEKYQKADSKAVFGDEDAAKKIQEGGNKIKKGETEYIYSLNSSLNKKIKGKPTSISILSKQEASRTYATYKGNAAKLLDKIKPMFSQRCIPYDGNAPIPAWMKTFSKEKCMQTASAFYATALNMQKYQLQWVMVGGKKMSFKEVGQRAYDYARAAVEIEKSAASAKPQTSAKRDDWDRRMDKLNDLINNPSQTTGSTSRNRKSREADPYTTYTATNAPQVTAQPPTAPQQSVPQGQNDGWGEAFEKLGLNGFSDITRNLGYVFAMLPDMIIGMFTGKNPDMKLQDNLLPVAAIFGGMFVRNPLLKMLLMGFGGANLLNTAGHAALDNGMRKSSSVPVRYKQYADEPLNPRIESPAMKGRSMVATIDGTPSIINISEEAVAAYEQGAIPLNTLANAVLSKYDESQATASRNYDRQMSEEETVAQTHGIR